MIESVKVRMKIAKTRRGQKILRAAAQANRLVYVCPRLRYRWEPGTRDLARRA